MRSIKRRFSFMTLTVSGLLLMADVAGAAVSNLQQGAAKAPAHAARPVAKQAVKPAAKARAAPRVSDRPEVRSSALLVVDEEDASVLLSKNAEVAAPIASITKLMTALVVLDAQQPLDEDIQITREDRVIASTRLAVGTTLSRSDLLHLALMSSENRAAHAVARSYPGGLDAMLRAMNLKATALGMQQAHFADPTGLSSENVASPADLSKLVMAASRNPTIRSFSTDPEHVVSVGASKVEFRNTNNLVRKKDWDIVVQKTGYTEAAGRCLVMKTFVNDRPVVIVLLNSFGKYTRVADAARIRRWMETGRPQQPAVRAAMLAAPAPAATRSANDET